MFDAAARDRWYRRAQVVILAASAIGAIVSGRRMLVSQPVWNDQPGDWARVVALAAVLMAVVVMRWPRHAATAAALTCATVAAALMTPGPVAVCALLLGAALVAGQAILGEDRVGDTAVVATLVGIAVAIGAFAVTSRLRIHYGLVHASIAIGVLIVARHRVRLELARAWTALSTPQTTTITERGWIVIAGVVAIVHVVVAARPETGYDASTMHLQFAEHVAADHSFRFGVDRYVWAKMPLGADYAFASAYLLGGEAAARALNLAFAALAAALLYRLARAFATREVALASATLFAAMPLAMLVTGSLFSEALWLALLLASLVVVVQGFPDERGNKSVQPSTRSPAWLCAFALVAGGAMTTKVMSAVWLAVLVPAVLWIAHRDGTLRSLALRHFFLIAVGIAIGAWPYADAWVGTGNPVFPFMNALFRSPLYDTQASFNNPHYNATLTPWAPWQLVLRSARFLEGRDGAIGLAWLFIVPLFLLALLRRPSPRYWLITAIAVVFFVAIYTQQSYLRYLLPALALTAVLASAPLAELAAKPAARWTLLAAGIALVAFDVRAIANANYQLAEPCIRCLYDAGARSRLVAEYAPLRAIAARLNRELPRARVGFLTLNEPAPAGFVGYSRAGNWHDTAFYTPLARAATPDAVDALVRKHHLTHVVYREGDDPASKLVADFAAKRATPLWRVGPFVVAAVQPASGG